MSTETDPAVKRLQRLPHEGPIAGVCAGIAAHFGIDPTIVRIAAVVLAFTGPGIPAYLIAWVFVPAAGHRSIASAAAPQDSGWDRASQAVGVALLIVAISILWGDWWSPAPRWFIPLGLVGLGVWLLARRDRNDDPTLPGIAGDPPPWRSPTAPAAATTAPAPLAPTTDTEDDVPATDTDADTSDTDTSDAGTTSVTEDAATDAPADTATITPPWLAGDDGPIPPGSPTVASAVAEPPPPPAVRRRRLLGPIVFGALLVWAGLAWLAAVDVETGLAVGLCIVGVGFVLGAFIGGAWSLVIPAVLVGAALLVVSVVDIPLGGGIGDRTWTVERTAELQDVYEVAIGRGTLDLSRLEVRPGQEVEVEAAVGLGELEVIVPEGVRVEVDGDVGVGELDFLGQHDEGINVEIDRASTGDDDRGTIELDLQVGIGRFEVQERFGSRDLELLPG